MWTLFVFFCIFKNKDYRVLFIKDGNVIIHRACVVPAYFRWPFMAPADVQISSTWTHPDYRGHGVATLALGHITSKLAVPTRRFWYVSREGNPASVHVARKAGFSLRGYAFRVRRFGVEALGYLDLKINGTGGSPLV